MFIWSGNFFISYFTLPNKTVYFKLSLISGSKIARRIIPANYWVIFHTEPRKLSCFFLDGGTGNFRQISLYPINIAVIVMVCYLLKIFSGGENRLDNFKILSPSNSYEIINRI